jgi:sodium transport system permease protein
LYHAALPPVVAVAIALAAIGSVYAVQTALVAVLPPIAAIACGYAVALAVMLVAVRRAGSRWTLLGLRRAPARSFVAAALIGAGLWYVDLIVLGWLVRVPEVEPIAETVQQGSLAATLVAAAVLPAICEEIMFRGVLARGLATRAPAAVAVTVSAAAFAVYHLVPVQMFHTFVLGLALGLVAVRSGSALPGMVAHAINNTIVIVVTRDPEFPGSAWIEQHPIAMFVACALVSAAGLALGAQRGELLG